MQRRGTSGGSFHRERRTRRRSQDSQIDEAFVSLRTQLDETKRAAKSELQEANKRAAAAEKALKVARRPAVPSMWDRFKTWYTASTPVAVFILGLCYTFWDTTHYPDPGEQFWTDEQVNNAAVMVVSSIFAVAMLKPTVGVILTAMVGCLLVWALF